MEHKNYGHNIYSRKVGQQYIIYRNRYIIGFADTQEQADDFVAKYLENR